MRPLILAVIGVVAAAIPAQACSIPIFRYALERWKPSNYELLLYHKGPLTKEHQSHWKKISQHAEGANIELTTVDMMQSVGSEFQKVWDRYGKDRELPCLILRYPESDAKTAPAWIGSLEESAFAKVAHSPARQAVFRQLMRGTSAVMVLLESGDTKEDNAAEELLSKELQRAREQLKLPDPSAVGPQVKSELPVFISFSVLRLSRRQAAEDGFVSMLINAEPEFATAKGPIVFALFGQGRLLCGLHGKTLRAEEVQQTTKFLVGACSCQVKELNPGVDMLFRVPWQAVLELEMLPSPRIR